tara:strand:- start:344 stop:517 length:174 start_codon:yes stop_codon:yes gene_type:complete
VGVVKVKGTSRRNPVLATVLMVDASVARQGKRLEVGSLDANYVVNPETENEQKGYDH